MQYIQYDIYITIYTIDYIQYNMYNTIYDAATYENFIETLDKLGVATIPFFLAF